MVNHMTTKSLSIGLTILLSACVTTDFVDSEQVDEQAAYLVITPRILVNGTKPDYVDMSLICVDTAKSSKTLYLPHTRNDQTTIVKSAPGACYLDGLRSGPVSATFKPVTTAFEAHPRQLNYAGDWEVRLQPKVTVYVGAGTADQSAIQGRVAVSDATVADLKKNFPRLSSKMTVAYTGPTDR